MHSSSQKRELTPLLLGVGEQELRERALMVQINHEDAPTLLKHGDSQIRRDGRFTDASLEVEE